MSVRSTWDDLLLRWIPLVMTTILIWMAVIVGDDREFMAALLQVAGGLVLGGWVFAEGVRMGRAEKKGP
jgi:hypothetical protein